ncbi:MAG: hypothetical protein C0425_04625 [Chlorobiaceae bacterium]|nr:hypothetical protein [Chlorobiaceae bacterium]MBA4309601.1 hypothetical protein [Chlorobiaceae bacterium]
MKANKVLLLSIKNSIEKFAERTAFCIDNKTFTYAQLGQIISNIKKEIESLPTKESLVGIIADEKSGINIYAAIYGSLFAGSGYVPINSKNPIERNRSVIEQSGIKTLLTGFVDDNILKLAAESNCKLIDTSKLIDSEINLSLPNVSDDEIAYILFTSGSTGIPKGVPITRANVDALMDAFYDLGYEIDENDRFMQMFELTFDFSVICYFAPLVKGASIYTVSNEGIKYGNVYTTLEDHEITFACMVPSIITYLKPYFEDINLPKLKYSLFCGEALYNDIAQGWQKCTPNSKIINTYGPTEATVFCTVYNWNPEIKNKTLNGVVCIGKSMKNMMSIVVDEKGVELPSGEKGELALAGKQLTPGYWKNPEKNKEAFFKLNVNGTETETTFYRSGDLALADSEGDLMYLGRKDHQVKIQGFRVELGEIEHHAREFTKVSCVAMAYNNGSGITILHLFLENYLGTTEALQENLKSKVPFYMVPTAYTLLTNFPLNTNGKIDRIELQKLLPKEL